MLSVNFILLNDESNQVYETYLSAILKMAAIFTDGLVCFNNLICFLNTTFYVENIFVKSHMILATFFDISMLKSVWHAFFLGGKGRGFITPQLPRITCLPHSKTK